MLRAGTVLLALAATALGGSGSCPARTTARGAAGQVTLEVCSGCIASMEVPVGKQFQACDPCSSLGTVSGEKLTITKTGSKTYSVVNAETTFGRTTTTTMKVGCGECFYPFKGWNTRRMSIRCPASASGLCPAKVGSGDVTLKTCGKAKCSAKWRVPLGEKFNSCDPCVYGVQTSMHTITEDGEKKYKVVTTLNGAKVAETSAECGECVNDAVEIVCPPGPVSTILIVLIVVGLLLCSCCAAAVFFVMRKTKAAAEAAVGQYQNFNDGGQEMSPGASRM